MIPLQKQVCSLELAERLKELEVKQDSYWYWVKRLEPAEEIAFSLLPFDQAIDFSDTDLDGRGGAAWLVCHEANKPSEFWEVYPYNAT